MKLYEILDVLNEEELTLLLNESIADELKTLVQTNVTGPFTDFKKKTIETFAKKLKPWAFTTLQDLQKGRDFDSSKHYVDTLKKILNNPEGIANQLFGNVLAKSATPVPAKAEKTEPAKSPFELAIDQFKL